MAGMEQLEIHSKSYLVRWVNVQAGHTVSWSIRPDKKSINFGIFKHPGDGNAPTPTLSSSTFESPPTPGLQKVDVPVDGLTTHNASSTAVEKLKSIGLKPISWYGTCEPNRVSKGKYDVPSNEGGIYALIFDNTFAKQFSKTATFVLLTYPTISPPQSNHHVHHIQRTGSESTTSLKDTLNQRKKFGQQSSSESVHQLNASTAGGGGGSDEMRAGQKVQNERRLGSNFYTGVLQKRRRKRHQGWARRFFSLDYTTSTLSYYHNRNTLSLRGAVPLSLAAIGANATTRQISIDSGAEIWHLKASSQKDFDMWKAALELARAPVDPMSPVAGLRIDSLKRRMSGARTKSEEDRDWARIEALVERVKVSRDAARTLAKDTDPKYLSSATVKPPLERTGSNPVSSTSSTSESPSEKSSNGYFYDGANERRPFWKRKPSTEKPMPGNFRRSTPTTPPLASPKGATHIPNHATSLMQETRHLPSHPEESIHDHCMSLLRDLDSIVSDFDLLALENNQRRAPSMSTSISRHSTDSQDEIFFDAEGFSNSQLLDIHHETDEEASDHARVSEGDSSSDSEVEESSAAVKAKADSSKFNAAYPPKPPSLSPLPVQPVKRRKAVKPPSVSPPSLIGFLRKNVGKDLSTISMPVSANEPISLLQRVAEVLEYSTLLDTACSATASTERLLLVAAFAIASLSSARVKERAIRKPFNPLLGETFELVREDQSFRFLAEKISHRPVRMACQADSERWALAQSPLPTQKFWGKSAELMTEGKVRVVLHATGDRFSWAPTTSFLRNIIAGEKYVEPVGNMIVVNETTGEKALVTFKSGGMFSGRSEDVSAELLDSYGARTAFGLTGKWTTSLVATENNVVRPSGNPVWTANDLPAGAAKRYGFTSFASSLNEITSLEKDKLPPTDSRLRPDQRAAEDGNVDTAEVLKAKLEEAQRQRRKAMEEQSVEWRSQWFERVEADDGEEVWIQKVGKDGYWERRQQGRWDGLENLFNV